jgi:hypothetical protein
MFWVNNAFLEFCTMILSFQQKVEVGVDKLDTLLLPDFCKYKTKEILFEVMGQRKHDKRNKDKT